MNNHLLPKLAVILRSVKSAKNSKLLTLRYKDNSKFRFIPGQFAMVGVPGFGEAAFDICGDPGREDVFNFSIRKAGDLTGKILSVKKGDLLTVRGPLGNGLPHLDALKEKNLVFIGGGCGFVTARSFVLKFIGDKLYKDRRMQLYCGVKNTDEILFKSEFNRWEKRGIDIYLAIECFGKDEESGLLCKSVPFSQGMITDLLSKNPPFPAATYIMCGPPIMYRFVIKVLEKNGVKSDDIYLALERRMHCGIGVCQHCAIGPYYVCKDGPIFRYDKIKNIAGVL